MIFASGCQAQQVAVGQGAQDLSRFPLLIKFLFPRDKLSVQVHPDDAYAQLHHNSPGKTEMWHVLDAKPGARIAMGLREPLTADRLRATSATGSAPRSAC